MGKKHRILVLVKNQDEIILLRGSQRVSNLLSSFSNSIKETRITSWLAYLISLETEIFLRFFSIDGLPVTVSVESKDIGELTRLRTDIKIETTRGIAIIEAKVGVVDPTEQSLLYGGTWKILITDYYPTTRQLKLKGVRYYRWRDLVPILQQIAKSSGATARVLSQELVNHLEEHSMIKKKDPVEIYARDLNDSLTTDLFLKAHMYGCDIQKASLMTQAIYFAPYFGHYITTIYPGLQEGISYLARVKSVDVVDSLDSWQELARKHYSKAGNIKTRLGLIKKVYESWDWSKEKQRFVFFLEEPRLVFNPSIKKKYLQRGKGWLGKRFNSFEEFFDAWSGKKIYEGK